jgi:hypothetical protein
MPHSQNFRVACGKGELKTHKKKKKGLDLWILGGVLPGNWVFFTSAQPKQTPHTLYTSVGVTKATPIISTNHLSYFCAVICCVI